jgi:hypothetical protein
LALCYKYSGGKAKWAQLYLALDLIVGGFLFNQFLVPVTLKSIARVNTVGFTDGFQWIEWILIICLTWYSLGLVWPGLLFISGLLLRPRPAKR